MLCPYNYHLPFSEMLHWQHYHLVLGIVLPMMIVLTTATTNLTLPTNCREQVYSAASSPIECARVTRKDLGLAKLTLQPEWQSPQAVQSSGGATYNTILNMWVDGATSSQDGTVNGQQTIYNKPFDPDLLPGACR